MWNQLPLKFKLTIPLVLLQISVSAIGITWMNTRIHTVRMRDLDQFVDAQGDAIEQVLAAMLFRSELNKSDEILREIDADHESFYMLQSATGDVLIEGGSPPAATAALLHKELKDSRENNPEIHSLHLANQEWHFSREQINKPGLKQRPIFAFAHNVTPVVEELKSIHRYMLLGCVIFIFTCAMGTGIIVARTTANLHAFATSLADVDPKKPEWRPPDSPASAEEQQLFSSFTEMLEVLKQANDSQRLFIANASHELKTPVAGILTTLQVMLARPRAPEEYEQTGRDLLEAVQSLKRLSTALLDLMRFEGLNSIEKTEFLAHPFLSRLVDRFGSAAKAREVTISLNPAERGLRIISDPELLEVALGNILDNAIKYSKQHGRVDISLEVDEHATRILIQDQGLGIGPQDLERLGTVFFRSSEARPDDMSFGVGFASAKRIMKALGAKLQVSSAVGVGTVVTVELS